MNKYLKIVFLIIGIVALFGIGIRDSQGIGIFHSNFFGTSTGTGSISSWAAWDELNPSGWGDSANTFIVMDDGIALGDEIGFGTALSEVNRTLTHSGSIPASSGSPPSRLLDGGPETMTLKPTSTLVDTFFNTSSTYILIAKMKIVTGTRDYYAFTLVDTLGSWIYFRCDAAGHSMFYMKDTANSPETHALTTPTPLDQIIYVFIYSNGTKTRCGVTTTKPTSWAAIADNDKQEFTGLFDNFASFTGICYLQAGDTGGIYHYYTILSKSILIGD